MHTRLHHHIMYQPRLYALLLVCSAIAIDAKAPRTFTPQTVTQMTKDKFMAPVDKRLLARKKEEVSAQAMLVADASQDSVLDNDSATKSGRKGKKRRRHAERNQPAVKKPARKLLSEMTFEEVLVSKDRVMATKNYVSGIKYIERALKLADDADETEPLLIEYADTLYKCDRFEKAGRAYNEFVNLYPGSDKVEYALYQAVVCTSKLILDAERDQSKTHETIELANQFLQRADVFKEYKDKVVEIKQSSMRTLVDSEFNVCRFYLNSYEYTQAQRRIDGIRKDWLTKLPDLEPEILVFECDLAQKQNKPDLITEKQKELETKFPQATIQLAQNKRRTNFLQRF